MIYSVIVDISNGNVDKIFDYKGEGYLLGQRVEVNFAGRNIEGFIVDVKTDSDYPEDKLKQIICAKDDFSAISAEMLQLGTFMQQKYHLRFIDVLRLFVPAEMRKNRVAPLVKQKARLVLPLEQAYSSVKQSAEKQRAIIEFLNVNGDTLCETLNGKFGSSSLKSLVEKGVVEKYDIGVFRTPYANLGKTDDVKHTLSEYQQNAIDNFFACPNGSFLLHGVTGSGKTEVYMTVIERLVAQGKNCIMLVPEISLTPSMMRLFRARFGDVVALLHSGLSVGERYDEWLRLKNGQAKIAIGARSAIFAPIENLGAIIVDEEHDASYISDFNPRYDTVDVAKFRRKQNDCMLILGSATPSLGSFYDAQKGLLTLVSMPERINGQSLPSVEIVDMRNEVRNGNRSVFSKSLLDSIAQTLERGNQIMLFLNRRGYSSFLMCNDCGYVAKCNDCDVSLTVHNDDKMLKCHYCGKKYRMLTNCPNCKGTNFRDGRIGTQQIVSVLNKYFPNAKVLRMDADTTQTKESHAKIIESFANHEADILVGTQMIAKGHDFSHVTLVGILDGDQSLHFSNYLSTERTFQLLTQMSGRSGRNVDVGKVILQTHTPEHSCLQFASRQDYLGFYRHEINLRKATLYPPFAFLCRVLYTGENEKKCIDLVTLHYAEIEKLQQEYPNDVIFTERMRCQVKRIEKKFRFQILLKLSNDKAEEIIEKVYAICDGNVDSSVSVFVERNPQNVS